MSCIILSILNSDHVSLLNGVGLYLMYLPLDLRLLPYCLHAICPICFMVDFSTLLPFYNLFYFVISFPFSGGLLYSFTIFLFNGYLGLQHKSLTY